MVSWSREKDYEDYESERKDERERERERKRERKKVKTNFLTTIFTTLLLKCVLVYIVAIEIDRDLHRQTIDFKEDRIWRAFVRQQTGRTGYIRSFKEIEY